MPQLDLGRLLISLTLSDAVFILAGLMRLVWQPGTGSSRVGAARACGYRGSLWGALLVGSTKIPCSPPPEFSKLIRAASDVEVTVPIPRRRATAQMVSRLAIRRIWTVDSGDQTIVDIAIVFSGGATLIRTSRCELGHPGLLA